MIYLNYQNYKLGKLEFVNSEYIYTSLDGEKDALLNCDGLIDYDLMASNNLKQTNLFPFFVSNFINKVNKREDILKKINGKDLNCYEILEKLSTMKMDKFAYWLSKD
ncbi:MAG: hypothetical protein E7359_01905 [Clostridiales bacterium]|nr:hypothetical protein [Clostridiales bacterium]